MTTTSTGRPLDGCRVLDISQVIAGPLAVTLLADHGADVLKIERPGQGDPGRSFGPAKDGVGLFWKFIGRNRRALTLDVSAADGRELFLRLVADADVVVESFKPGTLERWGLGYDQLREVNPGIVLGRVSGFGRSGPMAAGPGFGTQAEALSGFAHVAGDPDGPPRLPPVPVADAVAGLTLSFGIMAALRHRDRTGEGQQVDVSLVEAMLFVMGPQAMAYDQLGEVAQPTGGRPVSTAPRGVFRCSDDRWIALAATTTPTAAHVMSLVGAADLVAQPWFASGVERARRVDALHAAVAEWVGAHPRAEVLARMAEAGAAAAPVNDIADAVVDEQLRHIEAFTRVPDDELGSVLMQNLPVHLAASPGRVDRAGPPLGRHTDEVLSELGLDAGEIARLRADGVV